MKRKIYVNVIAWNYFLIFMKVVVAVVVVKPKCMQRFLDFFLWLLNVVFIYSPGIKTICSYAFKGQQEPKTRKKYAHYYHSNIIMMVIK